MKGNRIFRFLLEKDDLYLVIDCVKRIMHEWIGKATLNDYMEISEEQLLEKLGISLQDKKNSMWSK